MSEAALWKYLREKLLPAGIHATRIENRVSAGFPDVHYTYKGQSGTLELKFLRKKALPFGDGGLNKEQIRWHKDYDLAGGTHAFIVAQVGKDIYLLKGWVAAHFNHFNAEQMKYHSRMMFAHREIDPDIILDFHSLLGE